MSLRSRLILIFSFIIIVGFGSIFNWTVDELRPRYLEAVEETMVDQAHLMAALVAPAFQTGFDKNKIETQINEANTRLLNAKIYKFIKTKIETRIYITDVTGKVLYDSSDLDEGQNYANWNNITLTLKGMYGVRTSHEEQFSGTESVLHVTAPIIMNDAMVGTLTLAKPTNVVSWFIESVKPQLLISLSLAGSAILLLSILLSLWITSPIKRLTAYAAKVRDGQNPPFPPLGKNEMGTLGQTFYEMKETLEGKKYIENYIQNLTHELKTPLTGILAASEILEGHPDEADKQKFLGHIQQNTTRMKTLIDQMLKLAALENKPVLTDKTSLSVKQLVEKILEEIRIIYSNKNITINCNIPSQIAINGDTLLIEQALKNVLDNAFDFSPTGGVIIIAAKQEADDIELSITDNGPGFPDYALTKAFDRFFSLPRPDTQQKSTGLGLSFTKQIMLMHGGAITLANQKPHGAIVTLLFHTH